jgi:endonuclease YncB( thermonuclease family)
MGNCLTTSTQQPTPQPIPQPIPQPAQQSEQPIVNPIPEQQMVPIEPDNGPVESLTPDQHRLLQDANSSVPLFSLAGRVLWAKIVSVYDGDTCHAVIYITPTQMAKFKCRSYGIDCPEMKPSRSIPEPERQEIKARAELARARFIELCGDDLVIIRCEDWDKYGRLMATFYPTVDHLHRDESVNQTLIRERHAYAYDGGTKEEGWGK